MQNKKQKKAQRKKLIEQAPPPYTEGHWEDFMLESSSYYDIDIIEKYNAPIRKKIEKLILEQSKASSWLGKWYWQIKIDRAKNKLQHYKK